MSRRKIDQAKLQYWAGMIHDCQHSGLKTKEWLAGILGRYIFAVISGWIFFGMYASDYGFSSPVVYSMAYNGAYIFLEAGITIVILLTSSFLHFLQLHILFPPCLL